MVLVCTGDALSLAVDGAGGGTALGVIVLGVIVMLSLFICLTTDTSNSASDHSPACSRTVTDACLAEESSIPTSTITTGSQTPVEGEKSFSSLRKRRVINELFPEPGEPRKTECTNFRFIAPDLLMAS